MPQHLAVAQLLEVSHGFGLMTVAQVPQLGAQAPQLCEAGITVTFASSGSGAGAMTVVAFSSAHFVATGFRLPGGIGSILWIASVFFLTSLVSSVVGMATTGGRTGAAP